eukprot:gene13736-biopygen20061
MAAGADRTRTGRTITFKETDAGQTRAASFLPTVDEGAKRMGGVAEPPNPSKQGPRLAQPRLDIEIGLRGGSKSGVCHLTVLQDTGGYPPPRG